MLDFPESPAPPPAETRPPAGAFLEEAGELFAGVLLRPFETLGRTQERHFGAAACLFLGAPLLESLVPLFREGAEFGAWAAALALALFGALAAWFALSGLAFLAAPWASGDASWRRLAAVVALAGVPRLPAAGLSVLYHATAPWRRPVEPRGFSSGLDLLWPAAPEGALEFLARIGAVDIWCSVLAVVGLAGLVGVQGRAKALFFAAVGAAALSLGALTPY